MNHFRRISHRTTWCKLKRSQSSSSAINNEVKIPAKIKRGPTDILSALDQTIPNHSTKLKYAYHMDLYLYPQTKQDYRSFALSYESGKKAAMWIHKEHKDLFPKQLSDPEIKEFKPAAVYTDKSQVSEEILVQAIYELKVAEAFEIYKMLETNVSNETKQMLLELLCFYNNESNMLNDFPFERWFVKPRNKYIWQYNTDVNELYQFLLTQGPSMAAAAHNAMICGFARYSRIDEAWSIYQECKEKDVPLNITTYNYVLLLISEIFGKKNAQKVEFVFDILRTIDKKGIKPNVRTLNAALKAVTTSPIAEDYVKCLFMEFKRINVEFSLASYYYAMIAISQKDKHSHHDFVGMLHAIENKSFTIQDPQDTMFFSHAMFLANRYNDRKSGDIIHKLLNTENNRKFISNGMIEDSYYSSYISLLLSTSKIEEFFASYEELVPDVHIPLKPVLMKIANHLNYQDAKEIPKYVSRIWSDINTLHHVDVTSKLTILRLMQIDVLPPDSPIRTVFIDAAESCWKDIKKEVEEKPGAHTLVQTDILGYMALMLLRGDRLQEGNEILRSIVEQPDLFIPTMTKKQVKELFETCIEGQWIPEAFLVLEYSINSGFEHVKMATKLKDLPQLTKADHDKLINLVGAENLNAPSDVKSESS